jgi:hypothetical protein
MSLVAHHLQHTLQVYRRGLYGFLAVAVVLWFQGCGDLTLKPWHTAALTEEFTAAKADEVRTFEDYLLLHGMSDSPYSLRALGLRL